MKRFLILGSAFLLCSFLVGCSADTHEGLVSDTVNMVGVATTDIANIKSRVTEAIKATEDGSKLKLEAAIEATKNLEKTGKETQKLKQRIDVVRSRITDQERKANSQSQKEAVNEAFTKLYKQRDELRTVLAEAEKLGANAKAAVQHLREKITEAEGPFEALSR